MNEVIDIPFSSHREVVRCRHCSLNQFMTKLRHCRRCRKSLDAPIAAIIPPETQNSVSSPALQSATPGYDIATAVKLLRVAAGLSQFALANRMKTARQYVSKVENRRVEPPISGVLRFAKGLCISPYRFMRFSTLCHEATR